MATVIDEFVVRFLLKGDPAGLSGFNRAIDGAKQKLTSLSNAALKISGAAALPLTGIVRSAIDTDAALRQLEARTKATDDQLAKFKQQAYEVGSQLPLNTADILAAQTAFVQLGNSIDESLAATPAIAFAAVAMENVGIADAARYASVGLRAFGLDANEAGKVLDYMTFTETRTAASARDIGEAFRFSAQAAADAGIPLNAYTATLGTLAGSGRSAEESSQGLNVFLNKLAKGSAGFGKGGKIVTDAFGAIGMTMDDVKAQMASGEEGIFNVFASIRTATEGMGADARTAFLSSLVGESYASSFSFLIQNADEARAVSRETLNSVGEAADQAATKMRGVSGAWEGFKAQIDTLSNVLADVGISGPFESLMRSITDGLAALTRFNDKGELVYKDLLAFITTALKVGVSFIGLAVGSRVAAFALGVLGPTIRGVALAMSLLNRTFLLNPFVLIVAGIVGLIAYWDEFKAALSDLPGWFRGILERLGIPVGDLFAWIGEAWGEEIARLGQAIPNAWQWLKDGATDVFAWIPTAWSAAIAQIGRVGPEVWQRISETAVNIFGWLTDAWDAAVAWLGQVVPDAWAWLSDGAANVFSWLTDAWDAAVEWLGRVVPDAWAWLKDGASTVFSWLTDAWDAAVEWLGRVVPDAWAWLKDGTANVFSWLTDAWDAAISAISTAKEGAFDWLAKKHPKVFSWLTDAWDAASEAWGDAGQAATTIAAYFNALTAAVQDIDWGKIGETIGTAVRNAVQAAFTAISAFIEGEGGVGLAIVNAIRAGMAGLGLLLLSILRGAVRLLLGFISGVFAVDLEASFKAAWNAVVEWLKTFSLQETTAAVLRTLLDTWEALDLRTSFKAAWNAVVEWLQAFSLQDATEGVIRTIGDAWESLKGWLGEKIRASFGVVGDLLFGGSDEAEAQPEEPGLFDKVMNFAGFGGGDEPPLPVAPATAGSAAAIPGARTSNVNMEITNHIEAKGTTTEELAKNLDPVLRQHMNTIVENSDSQLRL